MGDKEMGGDTGRLREEVKAVAAGVARAEEVSAEAFAAFENWLEKRREAGMAYMHNHKEIRKDPRLLLEGAKSIICLAFGYGAEERRDDSLPTISEYALLPDYHDWIKKRIREKCASLLRGEEGKDWRICVDSAPIMERYWAAKAGLGTIGRNGMLIVPDYGSKVLLAEIITTEELETTGLTHGELAASPPWETAGSCLECGRCLAACPGKALKGDGTIDCNCCLSYLTIEHRGEWSDPRHLEAMHTAAGRNTLFGCDRCVSACPHNKKRAGRHEEPGIRPEVLEGIRTLRAEDIAAWEEDTMRQRLRHSCLKRAKREGLTRNALNIVEGGVAVEHVE